MEPSDVPMQPHVHQEPRAKHALQRQRVHTNCKKVCKFDPTIRHK